MPGTSTDIHLVKNVKLSPKSTHSLYTDVLYAQVFLIRPCCAALKSRIKDNPKSKTIRS
jgi:hypothetical protein